MPSLLKQGSTGPEVTRLQVMLNKIQPPTPKLAEDGDFGPKTLAAVMAFQKKENLAVDGIVGPNTWGALEKKYYQVPPGPSKDKPPVSVDPVATDSIVEQAVRIALTQKGVMEDPLGSNRGKEVDEYNATAGADPGSYWCMAFVYWCFKRSATKLGKSNPMPKTAYCPFLYNWSKKHGKLAQSPQRGDIFLVIDSKGDHHHTGIVVDVKGARFDTIEGNTNNDGSNNGIGVFLRSRAISSCDFVRLGSVSTSAAPGPAAPTSNNKVAWGAKVTAGFKNKVVQISRELGVDPNYLMACMAFETGESFSPSIKNAAGSGATGLIQFMPDTAKGLGTSTDALAKMSAETQLEYVKKYFQPYRGKLKTLEDVYMAILYPAAIGKPADAALFKAGTKVYDQNKGFDKNNDGIITPGEVSTLVRAKYSKGMGSGYQG